MAARKEEGARVTRGRSTLPPRWAEWLLGAVLRPEDREAVTGDILEHYRDTALPWGVWRARLWYGGQVAGFLWRDLWPWVAFHSGAFVLRQWFDFRVPTTSFYLRSSISTYVAISVLLSFSFRAAWRARSWAAGVVLTILMGYLAGFASAAGVALLYAVWHDPETLRNIASSGGLDESFTLALLMPPVPATVLGIVGATAATILGRFRPPPEVRA
jgi:hypothetical protein